MIIEHNKCFPRPKERMIKMETSNTKDIYSSMNKVWPDNNPWYDYLHQSIISFVEEKLSQNLTDKNIYLNAGSGGSTYQLPGTCYHVDIAPNLIQHLTHSYVASIENLPFENNTFSAVICVGSVINYCSALESISEFSRVLKSGGYLILEFERSQSAELWFSKAFNKNATIQKYNYLKNVHTLWLYSEAYISNILTQNQFIIIDKKRIHSISAVINKVLKNEKIAGKFGHFDNLFYPISYYTAHNVIFKCQKL